jgi:hypothetical protein
MFRIIRLAVAASAIVGLIVAFPRGDAIAQQRTLKEQLVGVWSLVSVDITAPNGTKRQDFGANPRGILILDASGRYALVQGRPDRPKFKAGSNVRMETAAAELGEAARAFAANFGTWSVNESDRTLVRRYEAALIPNAEGSETKVTVTLSGDELKLSGADAVGLRNDAVYRRAK